MNNADRFWMCKFAAGLTLGRVGGLAVTAPYVPFSTITNVAKGEGWRGAASGATTDIGRATGAAAGMQLSKLIPAKSKALRLALLLGGLGAGGLAGGAVAKPLGQTMFQPQSPLERIKHPFS